MEKIEDKGIYGTTSLVLVGQVLLMTAALVVLGAAIDWPASLDKPADVVLPAITERRGAVMVGYGAYMLYSILFVPLALLLYRAMAGRRVASPLLTLAAGFGVASALARTLGIVRWFVLMPFLAETYLNPRASEATRESVSLIYEAFNEYAGSVGEILGVQLFGGLFIGLISIAMVRSARLPSWIGYAGLFAALLLLSGIGEILGVDLGVLLTIGVTALQFWMLALAIVLVLRSRRSSRWAA